MHKQSAFLAIWLGAFASAQDVCATALGLPQKTARIGIETGLVYVGVDDPDGNAGAGWGVAPLAVSYSNYFVRDLRFSTRIGYSQTDLDATPSDIGQTVSRFSFDFLVQKSLRVSDVWSPWLGAGLAITQTEYTDRFRVDSDGFLLQGFADRSETGVGVMLSFVSEWDIAMDWGLAVKLEQFLPIEDDTTQSSLVLGAVYRF